MNDDIDIWLLLIYLVYMLVIYRFKPFFISNFMKGEVGERNHPLKAIASLDTCNKKVCKTNKGNRERKGCSA